MLYFWQGLTIGLVSVAPIGLQNLFVINTALTQPRLKVYLTALIVIMFDIMTKIKQNIAVKVPHLVENREVGA